MASVTGTCFDTGDPCELTAHETSPTEALTSADPSTRMPPATSAGPWATTSTEIVVEPPATTAACVGVIRAHRREGAASDVTTASGAEPAAVAHSDGASPTVKVNVPDVTSSSPLRWLPMT